VDRKILAELAVNDPAAFAAIAEQARAALGRGVTVRRGDRPALVIRFASLTAAA
jgi:hypothetical protein